MNIAFRELFGLLTLSAILLFQATDLAQSQALPTKTPDGRFGTRCFDSDRDASHELCELSIYRLIAAPEKYNDRLVMVTGYLILVFGRPVLFPSRDSYESGVEVEGIRLFDAKFPKDIAKKCKAGCGPY